MKADRKCQLERVWLIDDDGNEETLVRRALKTAELSVSLEVFRSPTEAIRALEQHVDGLPGLILCDLKLPGMDGLDFIDWLRSSPFSVIPLVIRSNSSLQKDVDAAYEHGANSYIQKGFDIPTVECNFKLLFQYWSTMSMPQVRRPTK